MLNEQLLCLDAQTLDASARITVMADTFEELIQEYIAWIKRRGLAEKDIWYAEVFDVNTEEVKSRLLILENNQIEIREVTGGKPMFKRSIFAKLKEKICGKEKRNA